MYPVEQVSPFVTQRLEYPAELIAHIKNKADAAALLELHPVVDSENPANDATILMYKGELLQKDCEAAGARGLVLAANKFSPAFIRIEGGMIYTLYSTKKTPVTGFVKLMLLNDEPSLTPQFPFPVTPTPGDKFAGSLPPGYPPN